MKRKMTGSAVVWLCVGLLLLTIAWMIWREHKNAEPISEEERRQAIYESNASQVANAAAQVSIDEANNERIAKETIRQMLKDPDSAQFRNITSHGNLVCGQVHAKNGFGGYTGFEPFSYNPSTHTAAIKDNLDRSCR